MAASEFAKSLAARLPDALFIGRTALKDHTPRQRMIDAELQEVRDVLTDLSVEKHDGPCWCPIILEHHEPYCLRARALLAKLTVSSEGKPT